MSTVATTFVDKLKDQSFTIILMIGGLYYQNQIFQQQLDRYDSVVKEKQEYINKIVDAERERMIAREKYLMDQRDQFIDMLKENQK
jgi:phosphoserine aminotransferase